MPDIVDIGSAGWSAVGLFAYSVPPEFRNRIAEGMRVLVPFGRKLLTGYVVGSPILRRSES